MKKTALFLILISMLSCKSIVKTVYGVNRNIKFEDKKEYSDYFSKKYDFKNDKIFFLNKNQYNEFMRYIRTENASFVYGVTLNDSIKIDDPFLNENKSCIGRISKIIHSDSKQYNTKSTQIAKFDIQNINGKPLDISANETIIFIISTKLGSINNYIKDITTEVDNLEGSKFNYCYISVDNPYEFK